MNTKWDVPLSLLRTHAKSERDKYCHSVVPDQSRSIGHIVASLGSKPGPPDGPHLPAPAGIQERPEKDQRDRRQSLSEDR